MPSFPDIATMAEAKLAHDSYPTDVLWDQLMAHTYHLYDNKYSVPEKGEELRDRCRGVITEALDRILITGKRNWNRSHYPDFKLFVFSVIDSIVIDEFRAVKKDLVTTDYSGREEADSETDSEVKSKDLEELCKKLILEVGASELEMQIMECILAGWKMPGEVREYLELSKEEFHNVSRKFSRKWTKVLTKLKNHDY